MPPVRAVLTTTLASRDTEEIGSLKHLREQNAAAAKAYETLLADLIEQAAQGMERLIDSLLRCAQAGQDELIRQNVSVREVVDAVRFSLSALISSTGARVKGEGLP